MKIHILDECVPPWEMFTIVYKIEVAEESMAGFMLGNNRRDRLRNEFVRSRTKVTHAVEV